MPANELLPALRDYLATPKVRAALELPATGWELAFLAQGEYNINFLLTEPGERRRVVRVNTGTQIGQAGGAQIAYEAAALKLLNGSSVAPQMLFVDDTLAALPYGLLVMEYLPGGPLRYDDPRHIVAAAHTLAALHRVRAPEEGPFIRRRPLADDVAEARDWLKPYLAEPRAPTGLRALFDRLLARAKAEAARHAARFPPPFGLAHTDVQAHNFIVDDEGRRTKDECTGTACRAASKPETVPSTLPTCRLVDWERPLVDDPSYDLAHFLIPTTTRWKCGVTLAPEAQELFLGSYCAARPELDQADVRERLRLRRPFILLRAVSWCAGAWVEYTGAGRTIANADTLQKIEEYLDAAYLRELFGEWAD